MARLLKEFRLTRYVPAASPAPNNDRHVSCRVLSRSWTQAAIKFGCSVYDLKKWGGCGDIHPDCLARKDTPLFFDEHGDKTWKPFTSGK